MKKSISPDAARDILPFLRVQSSSAERQGPYASTAHLLVDREIRGSEYSVFPHRPIIVRKIQSRHLPLDDHGDLIIVPVTEEHWIEPRVLDIEHDAESTIIPLERLAARAIFDVVNGIERAGHREEMYRREAQYVAGVAGEARAAVMGRMVYLRWQAEMFARVLALRSPK